jgi:hypothetical protein
MNLSDQDLLQIKNHGLTVDQIQSQIQTFKTGIPFTLVVNAATVDNGITALNEDSIKEAVGYFNSHKKNKEILKFVPASGAASRMFKFLFQFIDEFDANKASLETYVESRDDKLLVQFKKQLHKFPFYKQAVDLMKSEGLEPEDMSASEFLWKFVEVMMDEAYLDFGSKPKGLLPFHEYENNIVCTAFEEHLYESALYPSGQGIAKLHFTVSENHLQGFQAELKRVKDKVEKETGIRFEVDFSFQESSTDTIAVTPENEPFRNEDGTLLFRPAGHGALLQNLNKLNADIVFVKNIDNIVVAEYKNEVAQYKKVLAGILIKLQNKSFEYLERLDQETLNEDDLTAIAEFLTRDLNVSISEEFEKYAHEYKIDYLRRQLNRPLRVCGMVKNEGEPGGGPFWVENDNGQISLQIVESAQVDLSDPNQKKLFSEATHFNPVDLVCGLKDYKGQAFNLEAYVDHDAAFITGKTQSGKALKAMELPGLWNGSMAFWNTIFVEVPIATFNPVKTVNDLLKPQHQGLVS